MKIAVAGATGRLGPHVVDVLHEQAHEVVAMSRSGGVNVVTGAGLAAALKGVAVIIDASSTPSPEQEEATRFFAAAARNLHEAGQKLAAAHGGAVDHGIDSSVAGYNCKLAHEQAVLDGPVPAQILRAAQFHEFVEQLLGWEIRATWRSAGDAHPARRCPRRRREARRPGHRIRPRDDRGAVPRDRRAPRGAPRRRRPSAGRTARRPRQGRGSQRRANPDRDLFENGGLLPGRTPPSPVPHTPTGFARPPKPPRPCQGHQITVFQMPPAQHDRRPWRAARTR